MRLFVSISWNGNYNGFDLLLKYSFFSRYRCVTFSSFCFCFSHCFSWLLSFKWMKYLRIERYLAAKFGTGFAAFSVYVFFAMGG